MAVGALINRAWRLFGTGLSFTVFGVGGVFLAVLVFPAISVFSRDEETRTLRARWMVNRSYRSFLWMMHGLGVFDFDVDPECRERFAAPHERILVHASNFRPVKRVQDVVRVFAHVRERLPARLVLVGDGPELPRAAELAAELGVREHVIFAGQQESVESLLRVADLFLLPSEFESFGLAALEALSCGLPVIATKTGGLTEVVEEGKTGHLCSVGDVAAMASFAITILENDEALEPLNRSAGDRCSALGRGPEHVEHQAALAAPRDPGHNHEARGRQGEVEPGQVVGVRPADQDPLSCGGRTGPGPGPTMCASPLVDHTRIQTGSRSPLSLRSSSVRVAGLKRDALSL